ncbi:ABC transporter ATP-binding protein [Ramlibacter sp. WS9]|uniref:ABC transporter ATP-binding protein n=1 Tax=Ramlibacter sp. WS9 TaxID=1882741 RepID=UPI0011439D29|nr:ABC transporter ATP-binding protein [Ramlibacter sp. WS9]ROZ61611.1 ABC transporter ATP-binding protein [Ramlibacter sp. WS9]
MKPSDTLLCIDGVTVRFGGIVALDDVSFDVRRGEVCALIGPNGAGKSTLFNCLSRLYECNAGAIAFDGHTLTRLPRHRMAGIGIGRTFQNLALFRSMTVRDNVLVGCHSRHHAGFLRNAFKLGVARIESAALARADELIGFMGLQAQAQCIVGDLPFGTQKRVELARALACSPKLLLLDEPACGLNHEELHSLGELIRDIRDRLHITVLLVEHHMGLVMGISDRVVALNFGKKIAEGTPAEVRAHPEVIRAYLGEAEEEPI